MGNLHLVTGYAGEEHITSNDQGSFNAALMGTGEFVLERGRQFEVQVISNNKVRIFDGDLLMQGRHIRLKEETYIDLFFENGMQGYKRTDLIAVRYEKDSVTSIEGASLVVIKGVPTEDVYVSPEKITGDIISDHALQNDMLLYKVNFDGLSIQEPEKVFSTVPTLETMKQETIGQIEKEAEKAIQAMSYAVDELVPLFGTDSPTPETQGRLKQFYVNTENGELFICTKEGETCTWIKVGGGLGGVPLSDCKNLSLEEKNDHLTLTWSDPENIVFNGETIAEWEGTKVVRKEGSNPGSVEDGILITDSKVKDQYAVDGLQDTDVVADTQYNYALFPYTTKNVYTMSDLNRISGSLMNYDPVLANNTWEQISEASALGIASELWNLGDEKDGCAIIGFNHDDLSDGSGKAGITFSANGFAGSSVWNAANSKEVAYQNSYIKEYLDNIYSNSLAQSGNTAFDKIPYEIVKQIRQVSKTVYNVDTYATDTYEDMSCFLFAFSKQEVSKMLLEDDRYAGADEEIEGATYEGLQYIDTGNTQCWSRTRKRRSASWAWVFYKQTQGDEVFATTDVSKSTSKRVVYGFCV